MNEFPGDREPIPCTIHDTLVVDLGEPGSPKVIHVDLSKAIPALLGMAFCESLENEGFEQ